MQELEQLDNTPTHASAEPEAWRLEVDAIIAAIHPKEPVFAGTPAAAEACTATLAVPTSPDATTVPNSPPNGTQPGEPCPAALQAPPGAGVSHGAPREDPGQEVTSPAQPAVLASLRAVCQRPSDDVAVSTGPNALARTVLRAAREVHQSLGPGLLDHAYAQCLGRELAQCGILARANELVTVHFKGQSVDAALLVHLAVEESLLVDIGSAAPPDRPRQARLDALARHCHAPGVLLLDFQSVDGCKGMWWSREDRAVSYVVDE